jgi:hypothetical protein
MAERPLFLERASFRRRRLGDAARILPVLALLLVLLPVWWLPSRFSFAFGAVWMFAVWAGLILLVWLLHRSLLRVEAAEMQGGEDASRDNPEGRRRAGGEGRDAL